MWWPYLRIRGLTSHWNALDTFGRLSESRQHIEIGNRLLRQLRHFGNRPDALPEWREFAGVDSVDDLWEIWPSLPIITKEDLQTRFHPDLLRRIPGVEGIASSTGGSTGEPTPFLHDRQMRLAMWAATLYCRVQIGWRPWIPLIILWGSERDIGKRRTLLGMIKGHLQLQYLVDGYHITKETVENVSHLVARHRCVTIHGFTSMLDFVAQNLIDTDVRFAPGRVKAAWNGGEMLFEDQSKRFEEAFGVPILNYYGGRELSAMAYQQKSGGALDVLRPLLFLEIVDDDGNPAPPGEPGRLIWSSTVCRGTPFLRYDVGDIGTYEAVDRNSSGISRLSKLQGRSAGLITLEDGTRLGCIFWNHLFKEFDAVQQFQVVYRHDRSVHLRLRGRGFTDEEEERLWKALRPFFRTSSISIQWMEEIPLTPQGKLEQVVRQ
jgi:phenylacetate-CoA ligase